MITVAQTYVQPYWNCKPAMCDALEKLDYRSYHMKEAFANFGKNHMEYWHEALASIFEGRGRTYGKAEFVKLLKGYTVGLSLLFKMRVCSDI